MAEVRGNKRPFSLEYLKECVGVAAGMPDKAPVAIVFSPQGYRKLKECVDSGLLAAIARNRRVTIRESGWSSLDGCEGTITWESVPCLPLVQRLPDNLDFVVIPSRYGLFSLIEGSRSEEEKPTSARAGTGWLKNFARRIFQTHEEAGA